MAKLEGDQSIPAEWLDLYRATLTEKQPDGVSRKRYPYRVPKMQAGGDGVSADQLVQRNRFLLARNAFNTLSEAERQRWYAARPPWSSYLWYYNYFIMSSLIGNADVIHGGAGVIKSIQVMKGTCPTTGTKVFTLPSSVDADKTVVMIQGSARKVPRVIRGDGSVATGGSTLSLGATVDPDKCTVVLHGASSWNAGDTSFVPVFPYVDSLTATQIGIKWSITPDQAASVSFEVTEHVEGTVHPVLVTVTDTQVTVDWAEVPDAGAEVSITVIEYI